MNEYRIDIFMNGEHITRYFDNRETAIAAGREAKRDGATRVFLLKHVFLNLYDIIKELTSVNVTVKFIRCPDAVEYTTNILKYLIADEEVDCIYLSDTGEVIYTKEEKLIPEYAYLLNLTDTTEV